MPLSIGIFQIAERGPKSISQRLMDGVYDFSAVRGTIENVPTALPAVLPDSDVHRGQFEGSRFHDPATGIADQHGEKLQQAQIRTMIDAGNKPCIRPACGESGDALQKLTAACVGIWADE